MKKLAYDTEHCGWLIASTAPENITKGLRILEKLSPAEKAKACTHAECLQVIYARATEEKLNKQGIFP